MIDYESIQRFALAAVLKAPWEYNYRKICRWYSQTYATPLHIVELDLDQEDVLQHYFETQIEKLKEAADDLEAKAAVIEAWDKYKSNIINGYKVASEEDEEIEAEDDKWAAEMAKILAEEEAAAAKKNEKKQEVKPVEPEPDFSDLNLFDSEVPFDDSTPPDYD